MSKNFFVHLYSCELLTFSQKTWQSLYSSVDPAFHFIRIRLFTLMRIRILIKVIGLCNTGLQILYGSVVSPGPPNFDADPHKTFYLGADLCPAFYWYESGSCLSFLCGSKSTFSKLCRSMQIRIRKLNNCAFARLLFSTWSSPSIWIFCKFF